MTQVRTGLRWGLALLVAVALLGMAEEVPGQALTDLLTQPVSAQVSAFSPTPRTFGIASETAHVIGASEFDPDSDAATWEYTMSRTLKFASSLLVASVRLPAGAVVNRVELESCDINAFSEVAFALLLARILPTGQLQVINATGAGSTGIAATPGCGFVSVTPSAQFNPLVIDNATTTYRILVSAPDAATAFAAVRVYYTLQVSPAPSVATFSDVPTSHPFFQFVEALVASGITVGCGGGLYCVNNPITRGEMAVFLGKALGLHFAP